MWRSWASDLLAADCYSYLYRLPPVSQELTLSTHEPGGFEPIGYMFEIWKENIWCKARWNTFWNTWLVENELGMLIWI